MSDSMHTRAKELRSAIIVFTGEGVDTIQEALKLLDFLDSNKRKPRTPQ